ncbi:MAG: aminopeptidase P family protein [Thermoleophilia bacterium]|nr:aminopeptidase P family protein [Thermoleophilia bacterium]
MSEVLDRLRARLESQGLQQAVLSHPETLAHLTGFEQPFEDWPVSDPFTAAPPLLVLTRDDATLLVPTFYATAVADTSPLPVVVARTHAFVGTPPDAVAELERTLEIPPGKTGVEARALPLRVGELLRERGAELVPVDGLVVEARRRKLPVEVEAIRRASRLADVVQQAVKDEARPGRSEAEVAGLALAAMYREAGRRVPAVLTVTAGEATGTGGDVAGARELREGDLVLTDTSPWMAGAWSDTANAVVVGDPTGEQRQIFDAVRAALERAISLSRPGAVAGEVDRAVREELSGWGPTYAHHTGHGVGASWCERPLLIPGSEDVIEEDMVLAVEPAVYREGWGGIRLEHVFVVRASGNEVLTRFQHTL